MKNFLAPSILSLFCACACALPSRAENGLGTAAEIQSIGDANVALGKLREGFSAQQKLYRAITTLEYTATEGIGDAERDPNLLPGSLHFLAKGDLYWYDLNTIRLRGHDEFCFISSYDGEYTRKLTKGNLYMENKKGKGKVAGKEGVGTDGGTLFGRNFLFLPQLFSASEYNTNSGFIARPVNLGEAPRWEAFGAAVKLLGRARVLDSDCLALELPLEWEVHTRGPAKVRIYLNPTSNFYAMGWDVLTSDGRLAYSYRITKLGFANVKGTNLQLPYPQEANAIYHTKHGVLTDGYTSTSKITITDVHLNEEVDDSRFTIAPDEATGIFDTDANVYINVPK